MSHLPQCTEAWQRQAVPVHDISGTPEGFSSRRAVRPEQKILNKQDRLGSSPPKSLTGISLESRRCGKVYKLQILWRVWTACRVALEKVTIEKSAPLYERK